MKPTTATAKTTVKLTIKGVEHELTAEEAREVVNAINGALGRVVDIRKILQREFENTHPYREPVRPMFGPQFPDPKWPGPDKIMCSVNS